MRTTILSAALVTAAALTLTACGGDDSAGGSGDPVAAVSAPAKRAAAIQLEQLKNKPDLVLTDTSGKKYDLLSATRGKATLIYFGYTSCPDVCPLVMSNLGIAEQKLSAAERQRLRVVFVTTDPERDTPRRIRTWLNAQGGQDFVGLTGDFDTIAAAARPLGILVEKPKKEKDGSITVNHGAEVVGFSPKDDKGHWVYTSDATAAQYTKELPKIVEGRNP